MSEIKYDCSGRTFGRWAVIEHVGKGMWRCLCDCGTIREVAGSKLVRGQSTSCGCGQAERMAGNTSRQVHGHCTRDYRSPTYGSWLNMRARCAAGPTSPHWAWYGSRGITVCARWGSFVNFIADMGVRPEGKTLDRIDNDGNYEPSNCRWASPKQQSVNSRPKRTRPLPTRPPRPSCPV